MSVQSRKTNQPYFFPCLLYTSVASLIEKETDGADRADIASVIYNRLNNPNSSAGTNGYLQIDATLAYLNGGKVPTEADKSIDSPYNTCLLYTSRCV